MQAMSDPERPPLHPVILEQIDMLLYKVDQRHWPLIDGMQIPVFIPPNVPVPPQLPLQLLGFIRAYAGDLFKSEADQYGSFRGDERYPFWLSKLAERVIGRVLESVAKIDSANPNLILGYHGLGLPEMTDGLRRFLAEVVDHYQWKPTLPAPIVPDIVAAVTIPQPTSTEPISIKAERATLRDSYRAAFPDVKIADIIWAAQQTRREWTRWIGGEAKDGLKADRSFRHVLASGKKPEQLRGKQRPTKYNT